MTNLIFRTDRTTTTRELRATVATRAGSGAVDHRILHRLDVRSAEGLASLREDLATTPPGALVSHEDHPPGQGQYADRTYYERFIAGNRGISDDEARAQVDVLIDTRATHLGVRDEALAWLGERARVGAIRLAGHDPTCATEIDELVLRGGAVAEFPTTVEAAQAARAAGLPVVAGAPNVLRGGSHAGNVSGTELAQRGLVTALASDYLPSGLLSAAALLAASIGLPAAVGLVTSGGADVAGLTDRGRIEVGRRADLVLADVRGAWPVVAVTLRDRSADAA